MTLHTDTSEQAGSPGRLGGLALTALAAGFATGLANLAGADVLLTLALAGGFALLVSTVEPDHAWLWIGLEGAGILSTQLTDPSLPGALTERTAAALIATLVALLPAVLGAGIGVVAARRWGSSPFHPRHGRRRGS